MATAVAISPVPPPPFPMATRRVPLANVPNAVNSPRRAAGPTKRPRSAFEDKEDYGNSPVKKKQIIDLTEESHKRSLVTAVDESAGRIFNSATTRAAQNAFTRRLAALKSTKVEEKQERTTHADDETIRQWKRHYRKVFPQFVFYFESIPEDVTQRMSRQILTLGARRDKFFSKSVTHIVTTRPIPPSPTEAASATNQKASIQSQHAQPKTINPSLLDRYATQQAGAGQQRSRTLEATTQRRSQILFPEGDARRQPANTNDVLHKAREMGMKIWAMEKFERMMTTMFNHSTDDEEEAAGYRKPATTTYTTSRAAKDDLTQLLRNEKNVTEKQQWGEIVPFRGYYIYIHDMDEKTKPVMYREYQKVVNKEEGDWPMFHSVSSGRCPFVPEPMESKRDSRHAKKDVKVEAKDEQAQKAHMTRAASAALEAEKQKVEAVEEQAALLRETDGARNRLVKTETIANKAFERPPLKAGLSGLDSMPPLLGSAHANFRGLARNPGGEPMASGVQPSNITSAIRSQMISSTAAAPVQRVATSKDMYNLQKRVLDRHSGRSVNSNPSSYMNDVRAAINDPQPRRTTRRRAAETMTRIHEDEPLSDEDRKSTKSDVRAPKKRKVATREPKPGYCENCREKYDDFHEHIETRTHRKFALANENWVELDTLLKQLTRQ